MRVAKLQAKVLFKDDVTVHDLRVHQNKPLYTRFKYKNNCY